jgi:two-component system, chemotaxis family, chemotaxis protein CheY
MKMLVAEDDFISQLLMKEYLNPYGTVHVAVSGREAVTRASDALVAGEPFDLICLDIMMPDMDGQQALRAIRGAETTLAASPGWRSKIVMTTALAEQDQIIEAFQSQCDGYLVKPFDRSSVAATLSQIGINPPVPAPAR